MSTLPRPNVVTLASVFIAITAFLFLTELISALMDWGTVQMQEELQPAVRELERNGVEFTMSEMLRGLRWVALAMIPLLVAALVCAVYALRGDARSRLTASVLAGGAGLMSLPLGGIGLLQATMLLLAAAALWSPDANRWYRGERTPVVGFGDTGSPPPADPVPPPPVEPAGRASRPTSVVTASVVAIAGSTLAAFMAAIYLLVYTFEREAQVEAVLHGPFGDHLTRADLEAAMRVAAWLFWAVLPLAAVGLLGGIALLAGLRIGRPALIGWAWTSAVVGLLTVPLGLVAIAAAVVVIGLLRRDDVRSWRSPR